MWLIKNHKTGKFYKTKFRIEDDTLSHLHSLPFIEVVMRFDGRVRDWKRDCKWFTWLVVIDEK